MKHMDNLKRYVGNQKEECFRACTFLKTERDTSGVFAIQIEEGETSMQRVQLLKKKNKNM